MLILIISRTSSNMGGFRSKVGHQVKSLLNLVTTLEASKLEPIFIKLAQNAYIDHISDKFEYGLGGIKKQVSRSDLCKILFRSRGHNFDPIFIKLAQNAYINNILDKYKYGWGRIKKQVTRSNLCKNLVTTLRGHNFDPIFIILAQNAYIDNISDKIKYGYGRVKKQVTRSNFS